MVQDAPLLLRIIHGVRHGISSWKHLPQFVAVRAALDNCTFLDFFSVFC